MGLFDVFRKKNTEVSEMDTTGRSAEPKSVTAGEKKEPKEGVSGNQEEEFQAPGWDAITAEFERVYPGQTNPKHYATLIGWRLGGKDPLDGISIYDGGDYWHFVGYGLSELFRKESPNPEVSGFGMEFTLKLKKDKYEDEEGELQCICGILQDIARYTARDGETFYHYEYLYTGQTTGIDAHQKSNLTGFICVPDPTVGPIQTPNGRVEFLEFIGMTDAELKTLSSHDSVKEIYQRLGSDVTDYHRQSLV